jgi:two-component system response regulator YesN
MVRLLIVDDENITRETLRDFIPWVELGIGAVETANNGITALAALREFKPDILLCDVRMPKMDGIELASRVRESLPECKIIFLSGYSDKEYLKSAIHLQAVNYIEKPINFEEIKKVVRHAVTLHEADTRQKAEKEKLEYNINENSRLLKQRLVLEIVSQKSDPDELKRKYDFPFIPLFDQNAFFVLYFLLPEVGPEDGKLPEAVAPRLHALVYDTVFGHSDNSLAALDEGGNLLFISADSGSSGGDTGLRDRRAEEIFSQLKDLFREDSDISAGVGLSVESFSRIGDSYSSAREAVSFRFYEEKGMIYHAEERLSACFAVDNALYARFKDLLKRGASEEASELVRKLAEQARECRDGNISRVKNVFFDLMIALYEITKEAGFPKETQEDDRRYIWQEVESAERLSELADSVLESIREELSGLVDKSRQNRKITEIMDFINREYGNHGLSTKSIAAHMFFTQSYLCIFFKKHTGKTLNEYLTEVRIARAKELLKNKELKLFDIADQVGFADPNYFSVIFKKHTGCAPSEYRESYLL